MASHLLSDAVPTKNIEVGRKFVSGVKPARSDLVPRFRRKNLGIQFTFP